MFDNTKRHIIAESSKLKATIAGHIYSVQADAQIDNGRLVALGEYLGDEYYAMATPKATDAVVLVLQVPLIYQEYTSLDGAEFNFTNAKGDLVRCYELVAGDVFTVTAGDGTDKYATKFGAFDKAPTVGNYVTVDTTATRGMKIFASAPDKSANGFIGKIIAVASNGSYRVEVIQNVNL